MKRFGQNVELPVGTLVPPRPASKMPLRDSDLASATVTMRELACGQQIIVRQTIGCFVLVKALRGVKFGHVEDVAAEPSHIV